MKVLAIEKELAALTSDKYNTLLREEAIRVYQLYQDGYVREIYFNRDSHTAVIILECERVKDAEELLASLPLVKAGMINFELHPLAPYTGFSRLFSLDLE